MHTDKPSWTFLAAMLDFFGKLPGKTTQDFAEEMRKLTPADREEFKLGLIGVGYKIS